MFWLTLKYFRSSLFSPKTRIQILIKFNFLKKRIFYASQELNNKNEKNNAHTRSEIGWDEWVRSGGQKKMLILFQ